MNGCRTSARCAGLVAGIALLSVPASAASERSFKKTVFEAEKEQSLELGGEIHHEYTIELKPTLPQPECRADVSISYVPMYDKVRVETTVEHDGCATSSGDYTLRVRTRGSDGEVATQDIGESWRRTDTGRVESTKDYPVDPERELVWVRVRTERKTNCRCDDGPTP
ncbi:MAG: hypothetical protein OXG82_03115 [Gammaproteobacteria bacterium]|nr:hypothetical protein [Gammaproteobacteria bacterium]